MALTIGQIAAVSYPAVLAEAKKAANQWSESAFMRELERQGAIKKKSLGETIEVPLDYQRNQSAGFLANDMATTSLSKTEVLGTASYAVSSLGAQVTWSKEDDAKNPTENQKIAFVKALHSNVLESHDDVIEEALFTTSTNGFLGLQTVVPDSGQGSLGGINAATEVFWRNPTGSYLDDASDIEAQFTSIHNTASKGSGSTLGPKMLVSGAAAQALFESTQQALQRYVDSNELKAGFKILAFKDARYVYSQYGGTRVYFLSPKSFQIIVSAQYFRDQGATSELDTTHAFTFKIYSALQTITNNKSRLAVLTQTAA